MWHMFCIVYILSSIVEYVCYTNRIFKTIIYRWTNLLGSYLQRRTNSFNVYVESSLMLLLKLTAPVRQFQLHNHYAVRTSTRETVSDIEEWRPAKTAFPFI